MRTEIMWKQRDLGTVFRKLYEQLGFGIWLIFQAHGAT